MTRALARRCAAASIFAAALGASGLACPSRDLSVVITQQGVATLVGACELFQGACASLQGCNANTLCDVVPGPPPQCQIHNVCRLGGPDHAAWIPGAPKHAKLFLLDLEHEEHAGDSKCVEIDTDCESDLGCMAGKFGDALDEAFPHGLTFDGFEDPADGLLVLAVYEPKDGVEPCALDTLVACAGLAEPLRGGPYNITCASCQGGLHTSLGNDTGPCPVSPGECFLERCAMMLAQAEK